MQTFPLSQINENDKFYIFDFELFMYLSYSSDWTLSSFILFIISRMLDEKTEMYFNQQTARDETKMNNKIKFIPKMFFSLKRTFKLA